MTGRYQYRLRGAAEEPLAVEPQRRPVLGLPPSHPTLAVAAARRRLCDRAGRQVASRLSAALRSVEERLRGRSSAVRRAASTTSRTAIARTSTTCGRTNASRARGLPDRSAERARRRVRARQRRATSRSCCRCTTRAPHWPWETRDDEAESQRIGGNDRASRRRLDRDLPTDDSSHGRRHRPR